MSQSEPPEWTEVTMTDATEDTVRHRLARLECTVSRWRFIGWAAVVMLGLVVLLGASTRAGRTAVAEVFAREVILVDRTQTPRASMTMGKEGGPSLLLRDQQGKVRAGLTVLADGRPSLGLRDAQGHSRVVLTLQSDGTPMLRLLDAQGQVLWSAP
jgi:hypothetical protein